MRRTKWRPVIVGLGLIVIAITFFFSMLTSLASKSNDPVAMMQTVGQVAGVTVALGLVLMIVGLIGRRA